jgi:SAM-dependent methyltransferase
MGMLTRYVGYLWYSTVNKSWVILHEMLKNSTVDGIFLDLGCGDGTGTLLFSKNSKPKEIIGLEMYDDDISKAKSKGIVVFKADLNKPFPLPDNSVDQVFANQVIEHIIDTDNFVSEIYRVLKPNGSVVIATENLASWHNIAALLFGNQPYTGPYVSTRFVIGHSPLHPNKEFKGNTYEAAITKHNTVLSYKALRSVFEKYQFHIERYAGSGYYPWPKPLSTGLAYIDAKHSHFLMLKARKN